MKNLVVRTLSGLVLAAVVLGAIVWSQWSFGALLAVLLVGGMYEFYALAGKQGNAPQKVVGLVAGVVLFVLNFAFVSDDIEILGDAGRPSAAGWRSCCCSCPPCSSANSTAGVKTRPPGSARRSWESATWHCPCR